MDGCWMWSVHGGLYRFGLTLGLSKNFFTSHQKRQKGKAQPPSPYLINVLTYVHLLLRVRIVYAHPGWQSYCCWFLKWPLQYFRLFCHCVINKETLFDQEDSSSSSSLLNDGSANLCLDSLCILMRLTQIDRCMHGWMDCVPRKGLCAEAYCRAQLWRFQVDCLW